MTKKQEEAKKRILNMKRGTEDMKKNPEESRYSHKQWMNYLTNLN